MEVLTVVGAPRTGIGSPRMTQTLMLPSIDRMSNINERLVLGRRGVADV